MVMAMVGGVAGQDSIKEMSAFSPALQLPVRRSFQTAQPAISIVCHPKVPRRNHRPSRRREMAAYADTENVKFDLLRRP
jgi:hypothetical protein